MAESKEQEKVADLDEKEVSQSEAEGVKAGATKKGGTTPKGSGPIPIPYPN